MTDHENQLDVEAPVTTEDLPMVDADHPHAGVAEEGWSAPAEAPSSFAKIVVKRQGAETDIEFPVSAPAIIGRFDPSIGPIDVDLSELPESQYVSRKHAKIDRADDVWTITDLGSSNGTFLLRNDFERVETAEISDGQEFALGNARFVFHLTEPAAATPTEADPQS